MEYKVLREKGTSPRGGEYDAFYPEPNEGYFACRGCGKSSSRPRHRARAVSTAFNTELHLSPTSCDAGQPLYSAAAKFKSGCGWPAFDKCFKDAVEITTDESHGMQRIEITCARWVPLHADRTKALANAAIIAPDPAGRPLSPLCDGSRLLPSMLRRQVRRPPRPRFRRRANDAHQRAALRE